jgi:hypothetical protein
MPELKRLLIAASLTPEQLTLARQAFDAAWVEIAHRYKRKDATAFGRTRLAAIVLAVAFEGRKGLAEIQRASLALGGG